MAKGKKNRQETPTFAEEQMRAEAAVRGQSVFEKVDFTQLEEQHFKKKKDFEKAQAAIEEAGLDAISIKDFRSLGIDPKGLSKEARKIARRAGFLTNAGKLGAQAGIENTLFGFSGAPTEGGEGGEPTASQQLAAAFDEVTSGVDDLLVGGLDTAREGIAIASGDRSSPLAQAALRRYNEQFGHSLSARGLATSGPAALEGTLTGLAALTDFGNQLIGTGANAFAFGTEALGAVKPLALPGQALERQDLNFQRNLGFDLLSRIAADQHKGRALQGASNIFKTTLAEKTASGPSDTQNLLFSLLQGA